MVMTTFRDSVLYEISVWPYVQELSGRYPP